MYISWLSRRPGGGDSGSTAVAAWPSLASSVVVPFCGVCPSMGNRRMGYDVTYRGSVNNEASSTSTIACIGIGVGLGAERC